MQQLTISKRKAILKSINLRQEFHGDDTEKAMDLGLTFSVDAETLAPLLSEHPDILTQLWHEDGLPTIGGWKMVHEQKIEGIRANIDRYTFEACNIAKGIVIKPVMNRACEVSLKLQLHPGSQKCADRLWSFRGEAIAIEITQPQTTMAFEDDPEADTEKANP